jgi:hypothetical protein
MAQGDYPADQLQFEITGDEHLSDGSGIIRVKVLQQLPHFVGKNSTGDDETEEDRAAKPYARVQNTQASQKPDHISTLGERTGIAKRQVAPGQVCGL